MDIYIYNTILCELVQTRRTEFPCPLLVIIPKPESSNINIKPGVNTDSRKEKKNTPCVERREETLEVGKGTTMSQVL